MPEKIVTESGDATTAEAMAAEDSVPNAAEGEAAPGDKRKADDNPDK